MADGITSLNSTSWGTSTAGSAVSAETTLTLGVDRADSRTPIDLYHVWAAQLNAIKNLTMAMSSTFKGGTRLGTATQSASPFSANEQGLWCDTSGNPKWSYGGVANTLIAPALSAKGDIITYTGSAVAVLPVGANTFVLTADSTQPNGIKWAAGGGGSSTLAAAYANGASATDSTLLLAATQGKVILKDNATPIGTLLEMQTSGAVTLFKFDATSLTFGANKGAATTAGTGAFDFSNATGIFTTSSGTNTLSGNVSLASGKTVTYVGGASTFDASAASGVFKTTSGAHTFGSASWAVPANLVQTGASSGTNTTAQQQAVTLADGASSVGFAYKNATATTSAILAAWQTSTGAISGQIELDTIVAGSFVMRQPNTTYLGFLDSSNNGFKIQAGVTYFRSSGADQFQVSATDLSGIGASTQTIGVTNALARINSARYTGVTQTIAAATSITINPASGDHVRITLSATAITSLTISAGVAGEVMTVEVIEDATGTRTIPTAWTNVKFISPGTYTVTTTASKRDVLTFRYDATDAFWYEQSRSMNL